MDLTAVLGDRHPNRYVVDVAEGDVPGPGGLILYRSHYRADGDLTRAVVEAVLVAARCCGTSSSPNPSSTPPPPTSSPSPPPSSADGTIVDTDRWESLGADHREQVAALRWWTRTGQVHQVYVSPHWRRKGIGNKLVLVGAASTVGRRWPSLWGTGELTDLGEAWTRRSLWHTRVAPRSRNLPPMTPPLEAVGIAERNLHPDPH